MFYSPIANRSVTDDSPFRRFQTDHLFALEIQTTGIIPLDPLYQLSNSLLRNPLSATITDDKKDQLEQIWGWQMFNA